MAVSGVIRVSSTTLSHYHNTISHVVTPLGVIVYLVRALVLQIRAKADISSIGSSGNSHIVISLAASLTNLCGSAHFWRGVGLMGSTVTPSVSSLGVRNSMRRELTAGLVTR